MARNISLVLLLFLFSASSAQSDTSSTEEAMNSTKWRADIQYLIEQLPKRHRNLYHKISKEKLDREFAALDERLDGLAQAKTASEVNAIKDIVSFKILVFISLILFPLK